jgi:hypothetical protein
MMLVFTVVLGVNLTAAGIAQVLTEVISIGQFIGRTLPFVILTLIALWLTVILLRTCSDVPTEQSVIGRPAHA